MRKEERRKIYVKLLRNLAYDENVGNVENSLRSRMKKMSTFRKVDFEEKRIDEASYGSKVPGNSFDAALYLAKKFNGAVIQKTRNGEITHYYVVYFDEKGEVMVANPASDFLTHRSEAEYRFDIPFEKFKPKKLLQLEIGTSEKIISCSPDTSKIMTNIYIHNYQIMYGNIPNVKGIEEDAPYLKKLSKEDQTLDKERNK